MVMELNIDSALRNRVRTAKRRRIQSVTDFASPAAFVVYVVMICASVASPLIVSYGIYRVYLLVGGWVG